MPIDKLLVSRLKKAVNINQQTERKKAMKKIIVEKGTFQVRIKGMSCCSGGPNMRA
ncbi:hypothetical protein DSCO28_41720 [Desulfosarcina ovata subsp. sediminis]|uniref:Uncharacterized protein n=1 Tax=Desulfosarcina ovata subsp. sediminis TaxID=885957 RepID=A0A5K7ZTQ3_9BACT|nr:hypothetical protein [Desulfosarcina ovata]BBO83606.1 hypothetical protein DSCO28_41720 [Desulfosarcina ovata subsp. sediminis]